MIVLGALITFLYAGLILFLVFGFGKIPNYTTKNYAASVKFSIVVPFRNEAENLRNLFDSLIKLEYPKSHFEIILVNDASEDTSVKLCKDFSSANPEMIIQVIDSVRNSGSPKKDAVNSAIEIASNDYILTTDADCIVPEKWLFELNSFIEETGSKMVAGPVKIRAGEEEQTNFLSIFQQIDFFSLQGAAIGGFGVEKPFLCNGANLCFEKESFKIVEGFKGNEAIASGDDIFLLQKFQKWHFRTGFLKTPDAVVSTAAQPRFKELFFQRMRWAAKTSAYESNFGKGTAVIVFLMNLFLVAGSVAVLFGVFPQRVFLFFFIVKFNVDFVLIYRSSTFFEEEKILKNYFWCSFVYPFFSSFVALLSMFSSFRWKGRRFKK